jgi:hypothetical protein
MGAYASHEELATAADAQKQQIADVQTQHQQANVAEAVEVKEQIGDFSDEDTSSGYPSEEEEEEDEDGSSSSSVEDSCDIPVTRPRVRTYTSTMRRASERRRSSDQTLRRSASAPMGWPDLQPCEASEVRTRLAVPHCEESEEAVPDEAIKRRLAEFMMPLNLKQLAFKQSRRYGNFLEEGDVSPTQHIRNRQEVRSAAQNFQVQYGQAYEVFQRTMTTRLSKRLHTTGVAELPAYFSDGEEDVEEA